MLHVIAITAAPGTDVPLHGCETRERVLADLGDGSPTAGPMAVAYANSAQPACSRCGRGHRGSAVHPHASPGRAGVPIAAVTVTSCRHPRRRGGGAADRSRPPGQGGGDGCCSGRRLAFSMPATATHLDIESCSPGGRPRLIRRAVGRGERRAGPDPRRRHGRPAGGGSASPIPAALAVFLDTSGSWLLSLGNQAPGAAGVGALRPTAPGDIMSLASASPPLRSLLSLTGWAGAGGGAPRRRGVQLITADLPPEHAFTCRRLAPPRPGSPRRPGAGRARTCVLVSPGGRRA
jgi:hypothetical protein